MLKLFLDNGNKNTGSDNGNKNGNDNTGDMNGAGNGNDNTGDRNGSGKAINLFSYHPFIHVPVKFSSTTTSMIVMMGAEC